MCCVFNNITATTAAGASAFSCFLLASSSPGFCRYSFPRLHLPPKAIAAAKAAGKTPDTLYCLQLLEATGIVTVPGSGFGQEEGTFHLRTTILPPEEKIAGFTKLFADFHKSFMAQYK